MTQAEIELIVRNTIEQYTEKLPCSQNRQKIDEHEIILNNGLKDEVKNLKRWVWGLVTVVVINAILGRIF